MPAVVLQVLAWIIANPQIIAQGVDTALKMVDDVVGIYRRWQAGTMTEVERNEAWQAAGVDMQAVRDHWRARHPLDADKPTT